MAPSGGNCSVQSANLPVVHLDGRRGSSWAGCVERIAMAIMNGTWGATFRLVVVIVVIALLAVLWRSFS
jgi:hypothetical protein